MSNSRTASRRKRAQEIFHHVRSSLGCQVSDCGIKDPDVLELHHIIPVGKDRIRDFQSLTMVEKELALMTVVCANCHSRITKGKLDSPPAMGRETAKHFVSPFRKQRVYLTGQDHPGTALTQDRVKNARAWHPRLSYKEIAKLMDVSKNTIVKAVKGIPPYDIFWG